MNLLAVTLLLGLTVLVRGFPRPIGHGPGILRAGSGGQGLYGPRNSGNLDFGNRGIQWDSPYNVGSFVHDRSVSNINGRGISSANRANIYDEPIIFIDQFGGQGWDGSRDFGNWGIGNSGRNRDNQNNGGSFVSDRSIINNNGRGRSGGNRAAIYDGSGPVGNDNKGRISGDIFRNFGRDGTELGGYLAFE